MSLQAISWALDESRASANDRLVMIVMCHHAEEGFCWASRQTMIDETLLSGSTIARSQLRLVNLGEIRECSAENAPALYLALPANRRPRLFELTGFLGSHFADSVRRRAGSSQGARRGRTGSHATPSDQGKRDAIGDQRSDNSSAARSESDPSPDPNCIRCRGTGRLYRGGDASTGAFNAACSCCDARPFVAVEGLREDIDA